MTLSISNVTPTLARWQRRLAGLSQRRGATGVLMLLLFIAAGIYLLANVRKLTDFEWSIQPGWVALAAALVIVVGPLVRTWLWRTILAWLRVSISFAECFRIVRLSQLAKYLPGQVWHFVGTFYLTHRAGATKGAALSSMLYDNGASFVAGAVLVMFGTAFFTPLSAYTAIWVVAAANLVIGAVLLYPRLFSAIASVLLRILKRPPVPELPSLWAGHISGLILVNIGFWLVLGVVAPSGGCRDHRLRDLRMRLPSCLRDR